MSAYWYQACPKCHGQGRLVIKKDITYNQLFLCCDECMACWKNIKDLNSNKNIFYEFSIKSETAYASEEDIKNSEWNNDVKVYIK